MTAIADQVLAANQNGVTTCLDLFTKSLDGAEKLIRLNLAATQAGVGEGLANAKALLDAKDFQGLMARQAAQAQPNVDKALSYSQHVYAIASATQLDLGKVVEAQLAQSQAKLLEIMGNMARNAPPEFTGDSPLTYFKSYMSSTATLFQHLQSTAQEVVQHSTKQALSLVETSQQVVSKAAAPALDKVA